MEDEIRAVLRDNITFVVFFRVRRRAEQRIVELMEDKNEVCVPSPLLVRTSLREIITVTKTSVC